MAKLRDCAGAVLAEPAVRALQENAGDCRRIQRVPAQNFRLTARFRVKGKKTRRPAQNEPSFRVRTHAAKPLLFQQNRRFFQRRGVQLPQLVIRVLHVVKRRRRENI